LWSRAGEATRLLRDRWNLVALDLGLDLSTSDGKRVANQFVSVAQWERRLNSERTRAQGVKLGTPRTTPAPAVAKITKLRAQGLTLQAIADELNRLRVPTALEAASSSVVVNYREGDSQVPVDALVLDTSLSG